jgi:hypothetical protein
VCDRWKSFLVFLEDMGHPPSDKHELDRIDNDGDYSPSNCRWATRTEQSRNRRSNKTVIVDGATVCVAEAAEKLGIDRKRLEKRLQSGMPLEKAFQKGDLRYVR